jgi:hypothetical protein
MKIEAAALVIALATGTGVATTPIHATETQTWMSDPVATAEGCDHLTHLEIGQFLEKYLAPSLVYGAAEEESGRQMLVNYAIANSLVTRSQICIADALELKELADELKEQNALLTSGTSMSRQQIEKQRNLSAEADSKIEAAASEIAELTPEQRERFSKGVVSYLGGTYATAKVFQSVDDYVLESRNSVQRELTRQRGGGWLSKVTAGATALAGGYVQAKEVTLVFSGLKDHTGNLLRTSQFLVDYSKEKEIELPADATDQLGDFGNWG